jgi:hypothetical protein
MTVIANRRKVFSTRLWSCRTNRSGCLHWPGSDCLSRPDNFLYVFKPGPSGPGSAPPPEAGPRAVRRPGGSSLAALGLARTCQRVPPGDNKTRHQRTTPWGVGKAGYRGRWLGLPAGMAVDPGPRIVPLATVGKCGPARHASRASRSAIEQARPVTRTDPNLSRQLSGRCGGTARAP